MTREEMYLIGCLYAVNRLIETGSFVYGVKVDDRLEMVPWAETKEWLEKQCGINQDQLKDLPPAQPERKKGKWLKWESLNGLTYGSICSECGHVTSAVPNYGTKYCPDCGAEMEKT